MKNYTDQPVKGTMKAKKETSREKVIETDNEYYEKVEFHVIEIKSFEQKELDVLLEYYSDLDGEDLYWAGIYQDINGDFNFIDVDKLLEDLKTRTVYSTDDNEEEARLTHPWGWHSDGRWNTLIKKDSYLDWASIEDKDKIKVEYLGEAKEGSKKQVVCSSFNAG